MRKLLRHAAVLCMNWGFGDLRFWRKDAGMEVAKRFNDILQKYEDFETLINSLKAMGDVYIFGGFVRDAILGKDWKDIDIVLVNSKPQSLIDYAESDEVSEMAGSNKFSGFKFDLTDAKNCNLIEVDVWRIEETYAFAAKYVAYTKLEDLLDTTFFNVDAILYDVKNDKLIHKDGYMKDIENKYLDINLRPNVDNHKMIDKIYAYRDGGWNLSPNIIDFERAQKKLNELTVTKFQAVPF